MALPLVSAWGIPDHILRAPIGLGNHSGVDIYKARPRVDALYIAVMTRGWSIQSHCAGNMASQAPAVYAHRVNLLPPTHTHTRTHTQPHLVHKPQEYLSAVGFDV